MGEEAEGPLQSKKDHMGDDGQSFSVKVGNVSRGKEHELPWGKFSLFLTKI